MLIVAQWRCLCIHAILSEFLLSSFDFYSNFIRMHLMFSGNYNPNRAVIATAIRACETTVRVLTTLLFLEFSIRFELGLRQYDICNVFMIFCLSDNTAKGFISRDFK